MSSQENFNFENHKDKCRCCLLDFGREDMQIRITEIMEERFYELTQIELQKGESYSKMVCERCNSDLRSFSLLRKELIKRQTSLYGFVDTITEEPQDTDDNVPVFIEQEESEHLEFKVEAEEYMFNDVIVENHPEEADQIPVSYPPKTQLENPKSLHRKEGKVVCDKCGNSYSKDYIQKHIDVAHFKVKRFLCDLCDYQTYDSRNLKRHKAKHILKEFRKGFQCADCNATFTSQQNLDYHKYAIHEIISNVRFPGNADKSGYYCHICEKHYSTKGSLKIHINHHSGPEFRCKFEGCQKGFVTRSRLSRHEEIHLDQRKSHRCDLCANSYTRADSLRRHIAVVHDQVRFNCVVEDCGYSARRKDHLKQHIISIHHEQPEDMKNAYLTQLQPMQF